MTTDGKTRQATIEDILVGAVLRSVDSNGYSYPFSDMVVTRCYLHRDEMKFDCDRPHPAGVEKVGMMNAHSLSSQRYHVVLLASGVVATHHIKSRYEGTIPEYADMFTVEDWSTFVKAGSFNTYDGTGYWCKDGKESRDEVFSTDAGDATHVAWYNK